MHAGLITSIVLHAALLLWALIVMHATPELRPPEPESVEIALITPSELLRLKQGDVNAKELEAKAKETEPKPDISKKEAEKPNPITADKPPEPEPPPPEPKAAEKPPEAAKAEPPPPDPIAEKLAAIPPEPTPTPAPGPTPEEMKKIEELKAAEEAKKKAVEDKKKADEKKKADDKKKADEKKKADKIKEAKVQADKLAALLNKDPNKKGAPQASSTPTKPTDYTGPVAGAEKGTDTVLSAREQDLLKGKLKSQLARCWNLPGGGGGTETPVVTLKWRLRADGGLDGEPQIVNPGTGAFAGLAVESAIRAVKNCQPFTLPPDSYAAWKEIEWDFDPRQML